MPTGIDADTAENHFERARVHWQIGEKAQAGTWFDKAAEWTKENAPDDEGLRQLWTEAGKLLGRSGPQ